jgi:protein disulfide-isomerase A1
MAPSYAQLAQKMNAKEDGIPIAEVDATEQPELAEKFGVEGYPSLKFFVDGQPIDYNGEREGDAIEMFINKKMNPTSKELTKTEELSELETSKLSVVLVTNGPAPEQLAVFNTFSANYEVPFYFTTFAEALGLTGSTGKYNFVVYRNFDDGRKVLSSENQITAEEMKTFLDSLRYPTVMDFDQEAAEKIFGGEETCVFLFTNDKTNDAVTLFNQVANERKGEVIFSKSTIKGDLGERLSEYLGITDEDNNTIRLVRFEGGNVVKYRLHDWTKADLLSFLDEFKAGTLQPYFKSDPVPETNSAPIKVVVGKTFDELVLNNEKWVLLEIYAEWCGQCKKIAPMYEELGKKLEGHPDIVIAKMDGTTNEHSSIAVKGFPTIKFYRSNDKQNPIDYDGDRTLEGMLSFLEKETGKSLGASGVKSESAESDIVDENL